MTSTVTITVSLPEKASDWGNPPASKIIITWSASPVKAWDKTGSSGFNPWIGIEDVEKSGHPITIDVARDLNSKKTLTFPVYKIGYVNVFLFQGDEYHRISDNISVDVVELGGNSGALEEVTADLVASGNTYVRVVAMPGTYRHWPDRSIFSCNMKDLNLQNGREDGDGSKSVMSGDVNACKAKCNSLHNCKGFNFHVGQNQCWMKTTNITDDHPKNKDNECCGGGHCGRPAGSFDFYSKDAPPWGDNNTCGSGRMGGKIHYKGKHVGRPINSIKDCIAPHIQAVDYYEGLFCNNSHCNGQRIKACAMYYSDTTFSDQITSTTGRTNPTDGWWLNSKQCYMKKNEREHLNFVKVVAMRGALLSNITPWGDNNTCRSGKTGGKTYWKGKHIGRPINSIKDCMVGPEDVKAVDYYENFVCNSRYCMGQKIKACAMHYGNVTFSDQITSTTGRINPTDVSQVNSQQCFMHKNEYAKFPAKKKLCRCGSATQTSLACMQRCRLVGGEFDEILSYEGL
jgi:hypothetical protein